jgi:hypothetical protein
VVLLNAQEIANALWALAKLADGGPLYAGVLSPTNLQTLIARAVALAASTDIKEALNAQDIATALLALAKLADGGHLSAGVLSPANLQTLIARAVALAASTDKEVVLLNAQEIANALWALAKLADGGPLYAGVLSPANLQTLIERVVALAGTITAQEIPMCLQAASILNLTLASDERFVNSLLMSNAIMSCTATGIVIVITMAAELGVKFDPSGVRGKLLTLPLSAVEQIADQNGFTAADIRQILWALMEMEVPFVGSDAASEAAALEGDAIAEAESGAASAPPPSTPHGAGVPGGGDSVVAAVLANALAWLPSASSADCAFFLFAVTRCNMVKGGALVTGLRERVEKLAGNTHGHFAAADIAVCVDAAVRLLFTTVDMPHLAAKCTALEGVVETAAASGGAPPDAQNVFTQDQRVVVNWWLEGK